MEKVCLYIITCSAIAYLINAILGWLDYLAEKEDLNIEKYFKFINKLDKELRNAKIDVKKKR